MSTIDWKEAAIEFWKRSRCHEARASNSDRRARAQQDEIARLRGVLTDRQRYLHCEVHVDARHYPIGEWKDCNRPTCMDTRQILTPTPQEATP